MTGFCGDLQKNNVSQIPKTWSCLYKNWAGSSIFTKSELLPNKKLDFLGYQFDIRQGSGVFSQKKLYWFKNQPVSIRKSLVLTPRMLMSLTWILVSLEKTIPQGRLPPSTDIKPNLQSLAHTNGRLVCHSSKPQTTNLCISCPRQKGLENRYIEYLLGRPRRLCLLSSSSSHTATSYSTDSTLPMQDDLTGSRVTRDALVPGSGRSLNQDIPKAPTLEDSTETVTFQQVPQQRGIPESTCVASGFQESNSGRFSTEAAERIKAPQRESSRKVYQLRWSIYLLSCRVKILRMATSKPSIISSRSPLGFSHRTSKRWRNIFSVSLTKRQVTYTIVLAL